MTVCLLPSMNRKQTETLLRHQSGDGGACSSIFIDPRRIKENEWPAPADLEQCTGKLGTPSEQSQGPIKECSPPPRASGPHTFYPASLKIYMDYVCSLFFPFLNWRFIPVILFSFYNYMLHVRAAANLSF